ncbi:cyclic phosphodiesterase [Raphidocelis subcapitata]|uniref:Cyclic phosphodiesterase n=1 Tax=Raphidocelis subcapitata TaxID=307507 RepID=A0A2V0P9Y7_9CHLO|nr:cyclic phosphodiesterase [Raphidocelis subcapitata]|eukprot:GBF93915.1 cyclic phosphodiesterase [Raphidocelis subcapitata]
MASAAAAAGPAAGPRHYSIWIEPPPGALRDALQREIGAQRAARGGPPFEAHVTLLGDIPAADDGAALEAAAQLAARLEPFRVNFLDVSTGASFYQCVLILCAKEAQLLAANAAARGAFGMPDPPRPYMPHLSLLYADIDDEARAAAAAEAVARLWGDAAGYGTLLPASGFDAGAFAVWETPAADRSLGSWRRVGEFRLGGPR